MAVDPTDASRSAAMPARTLLDVMLGDTIPHFTAFAQEINAVTWVNSAAYGDNGLLRRVANVAGGNGFCRSRLTWAVRIGDRHRVRLLLDAGADPFKDTGSSTSYKAGTPEGSNALLAGILAGEVECVAEILSRLELQSTAAAVTTCTGAVPGPGPADLRLRAGLHRWLSTGTGREYQNPFTRNIEDLEDNPSTSGIDLLVAASASLHNRLVARTSYSAGLGPSPTTAPSSPSLSNIVTASLNVARNDPALFYSRVRRCMRLLVAALRATAAADAVIPPDEARFIALASAYGGCDDDADDHDDDIAVASGGLGEVPDASPSTSPSPAAAGLASIKQLPAGSESDAPLKIATPSVPAPEAAPSPSSMPACAASSSSSSSPIDPSSHSHSSITIGPADVGQALRWTRAVHPGIEAMGIFARRVHGGVEDEGQELLACAIQAASGGCHVTFRRLVNQLDDARAEAKAAFEHAVTSMLRTAVKRGHFRIVQLLYFLQVDHYPSLGFGNTFLSLAGTSGNLSMVHWLLSARTRDRPTSMPSRPGSSSDSSEVTTVAVQLGMQEYAICFSNAASAGHTHILKWMMRHVKVADGADWPLRGATDALKLMTQAPGSAAGNGHAGTLRWILHEYSPRSQPSLRRKGYDMQYAYEQAAAGGHVSCMQLLWDWQVAGDASAHSSPPATAGTADDVTPLVSLSSARRPGSDHQPLPPRDVSTTTISTSPRPPAADRHVTPAAAVAAAVPTIATASAPACYLRTSRTGQLPIAAASNEVCRIAAMHGHLEALVWARCHGFGWDREVCWQAVGHRRRCMLEWLQGCEGGCPCKRTLHRWIACAGTRAYDIEL